MKKINLAISGCMGRMGQQLIKSSKKNKNFKLVTLTENRLVNKKKLFYKAIIWNIIGLVITSIISFLWFGNWIQSLSFSLILIIISIFTYVLYEIVWIKLSKKNEKN